MPIMVDGKSVFPMNPTDFTKGMMRYRERLRRGRGGRVLRDDAGAPEDAVRRGGGGEAEGSGPSCAGRRLSSLMTAVGRAAGQQLPDRGRADEHQRQSRQFKRLLQAEDWDGLVSMARDEVREGSAIVLDVCVDFVGRDGVRDMREVVRRYVNSVERAADAGQHQPQGAGGGG